MKMTIKQTIDREAYLAWVRKLEDQLPLYVTCPDCNGDGEGECPHCGNMTDCDSCGGDGLVRPSVLLDEQFYLRVMAYEKARLEHWVQGDPIPVDKRSNWWNPIDEILQGSERPHSPHEGPKIVLHLPLTESAA